MERSSPTAPHADVAGIATLKWLDDMWRFLKTKNGKWDGRLKDVVHTRPWLQALGISLGHRAHYVLKSRVPTTENWYVMTHCMVAALQLFLMCSLSPILRSQDDVNVTALDLDGLFSSLE